MRKTVLAVLITGIVFVVFSAGSASGQRDGAAGDQGAKLVAGAQIVDIPGVTDTRKVALEAFKDSGGATTGQAQVHAPFAGLDYKVSIKCLIVRGNQAIVGGTITSANDPTIVGATGAFAIQDEPDQISFGLFNTVGESTITCSNFLAQAGETSITGALTSLAVPNERSLVTIGQSDQ